MDARQQDLHSRTEARHWWFLGKQRIIKTLLAASPASGKQHLVVDVGCGPGGTVGGFAAS